MDSIFDLDHLYRTYFKMALPSVFGLMVSVVYNLADTFFIAQSNDTALIAGVSLCAPVFTALMAFGNIYGQGGSSLISRLLGQDDREGTRPGQLVLLLCGPDHGRGVGCPDDAVPRPAAGHSGCDC